MTGLRRRLAERLRSERGFTLIELLVTVLIGMLTLMIVVELVDVSQGASSRVQSRVDGTQRGRVAMEQVTQALRSQVCLGSTPPVIAGDDDSVTVYVDMEDEVYRPQQRRIHVTDGDLWEETFVGTGDPPDMTYPASPTSTRVVLEGIKRYQDPTTVPYFRFFAYDASDPARPDELLPTPLSPSDIPRVVRVETAFSVAGVNSQDARVDTNFKNGVTTRLANPMDPDPTKRGPQCR